MAEDERSRWERLQRERARNLPRSPEEASIVREDAANPRVLHPGNEDEDVERVRARLSHWAEEEGPGGRAARELAELDRRMAEQGAAGPVPEGGAEAPVGSGAQTAPEEWHPHGGRSRAGEPKKHPRPPEETTPRPGRGREGFDADHPERAARTAPERTVRPPAQTGGPKREEE